MNSMQTIALSCFTSPFLKIGTTFDHWARLTLSLRCLQSHRKLLTGNEMWSFQHSCTVVSSERWTAWCELLFELLFPWPVPKYSGQSVGMLVFMQTFGDQPNCCYYCCYIRNLYRAWTGQQSINGQTHYSVSHLGTLETICLSQQLTHSGIIVALSFFGYLILLLFILVSNIIIIDLCNCASLFISRF